MNTFLCHCEENGLPIWKNVYIFTLYGWHFSLFYSSKQAIPFLDYLNIQHHHITFTKKELNYSLSKFNPQNLVHKNTHFKTAVHLKKKTNLETNFFSYKILFDEINALKITNYQNCVILYIIIFWDWLFYYIL